MTKVTISRIILSFAKKSWGLVRFLMVYYWAHHTMNDHKHPHNITIVPYYWVIFNGKHQHFMKHG